MTAHTVNTILVGLNNSRENRSLFKEALAIASSMRAQVIVVSVTPSYEGNMNRIFLNDADKLFRKPLEKTLQESEKYAISLGLQLTTILRTGKPWEEIVAVAIEENTDLIILGCSKKLQVERLLLGRTTVEVILNGPCDVLLIPEDAEVRFDKILIWFNGSSQSIEAGTRALELASSYGGEVHALYITDIPADRVLRYGVMKEAEKKGWEILKDFISRGEYLDVPVIATVKGNVPESCIAEYAKERNINLIVLGTTGSETLGFDMFFGSVIERVTSQVSCPILVAKTRDEN